MKYNEMEVTNKVIENSYSKNTLVRLTRELDQFLKGENLVKAVEVAVRFRHDYEIRQYMIINEKEKNPTAKIVEEVILVARDPDPTGWNS